MDEYIEREKLIENIRVMPRHSNPALVLYPLVQRVIFEAPTADVVEVVRCKDCKHLKVLNGEALYAYCTKTEYRFLPFETDTRTHYCSFGERKEGAEE